MILVLLIAASSMASANSLAVLAEPQQAEPAWPIIGVKDFRNRSGRGLPWDYFYPEKLHKVLHYNLESSHRCFRLTNINYDEVARIDMFAPLHQGATNSILRIRCNLQDSGSEMFSMA